MKDAKFKIGDIITFTSKLTKAHIEYSVEAVVLQVLESKKYGFQYLIYNPHDNTKSDQDWNPYLLLNENILSLVKRKKSCDGDQKIDYTLIAKPNDISISITSPTYSYSVINNKACKMVLTHPMLNSKRM